MPNRPMLRAPAAAAYLGITPRTLRTLVERGDLGYHRIGGVNMFRPVDLDAYLQATRIDPVPPTPMVEGCVLPGRAEP